MHQPHAIDDNQRRLRRVVARLLALSDLAERVAGRSRAVCLVIVWLLRCGEASAWAYLDDLSPGSAPDFAPAPLRPDEGEPAGCAAEALRLATSFRTIAVLLAAFFEDGPTCWQEAPAHDLVASAGAALPSWCDCAAAVGRLDSS